MACDATLRNLEILGEAAKNIPEEVRQPGADREGAGLTWISAHRTTLTLELPEEVFSALRRSSEELGREMCLAAAIRWYQQGRLSQEMAARVAGLDRTDFLLALAREGVDAFGVDFGGLQRELDENRMRAELEHHDAQSAEETPAAGGRLLAVQELASLSLPVASPEEIEAESCPAPDDLLPGPPARRG
jgi:predicted HTH domain antitoxin